LHNGAAFFAAKVADLAAVSQGRGAAQQQRGHGKTSEVWKTAPGRKISAAENVFRRYSYSLGEEKITAPLSGCQARRP
jgi:hypothetical protein